MCENGRNNFERMLSEQKQSRFVENTLTLQEVNKLVYNARKNPTTKSEVDFDASDILVCELLGMPVTFGERINQHLIRLRIKLSDAAKKLGISTMDLKNIINDKSLPWDIDVSIMKRLHSSLEVPVDYLIQSIYDHPIFDEDICIDQYSAFNFKQYSDDHQKQSEDITEKIIQSEIDRRESFLETLLACF